ncbi:hypothetical protein OUZ56_023255 [Daphnia magna]|uniref:Uncharacterized protein n=1 Tax=Daphnia magna TaxID=35525 RepID=A0ABR0AYQ8_9CRUS|nr:hypothetical protein OUZ56_023255 [Daphnia magna]
MIYLQQKGKGVLEKENAQMKIPGVELITINHLLKQTPSKMEDGYLVLKLIRDLNNRLAKRSWADESKRALVERGLDKMAKALSGQASA